MSNPQNLAKSLSAVLSKMKQVAGPKSSRIPASFKIGTERVKNSIGFHSSALASTMFGYLSLKRYPEETRPTSKKVLYVR
ncbi:hypothetical protein BWQ96_08374 [Gracilariopsis chorda]|uniref:Uncharacterized protein n=1 Tax=Gracilariopsis chorda TaxID=448386 RepID=A0A2V3IIM5_9FLOR|nr:hypothetical protein BWQ96_08374 [Gracilariopsis chorda]|eukprot:PXF41922.1 hypothetical protein BWQ96_08374 [Gracilariopsis chorda]